MATFRLQIQCDGAAFGENIAGEVARLLRGVAAEVSTGYLAGGIVDAYDDRAGSYMMVTEPQATDATPQAMR